MSDHLKSFRPILSVVKNLSWEAVLVSWSWFGTVNGVFTVRKSTVLSYFAITQHTLQTIQKTTRRFCMGADIMFILYSPGLSGGVKPETPGQPVGFSPSPNEDNPWPLEDRPLAVEVNE